MIVICLLQKDNYYVIIFVLEYRFKMKRISLLLGNGCGKTTAVLGLALRSLGQGKKVVMCQFMKGQKDIGEYKIQKRLRNFKVYQFGRKEFVDLKKPTKKDKELAKKGFSKVDDIVKKEKPFLLILDEVNLATAIGLLDKRDVLELVKRLKKKTNIALTGRKAPKDLIRIADVVSDVKLVKRRKLPTTKGFEF